MKGYIHSFETFASVDGPGVRFAVFMSGCPLRCQYCHNPDTWVRGNDAYEAEEVLKRALRYKSYWRNGGGITVSGGEPLVQAEFVTELFTLAKKAGVNTCLDTSGIMFDEKNPTAFDALLNVTDLVMLDIKHIDEEKHISLTGKSNKSVLAFARHLSERGIPVWIRHVVVPGITSDEDALYSLGKFIGTLKNVKKVETLPYHSMGKYKYEKLGIEYPLSEVPDTDKEKAAYAYSIIEKGINAVR